MAPFPLPWPKRRVVETPQPVGHEILRDGPLLARWYILYRLAEEMQRAHRSHRSLSVVLGTPAVLPGKQLGEEALVASATAARVVARRSDLVGWLEGGTILIIMPETNDDEAKVAVFRWRNEIMLRTRRKWQFAVIKDVDRYKNTEEVLQAATQELTSREAA